MSNTATTVLTTIEGGDSGGDSGAVDVGDGSTPEAGAALEGGAPVTPAVEPPGPDPRLQLAEKISAASKREQRTRANEIAFQKRVAEFERHEAERADARKKFEQEQADFEADPVAFYLAKGKDPVEAVRRFAKPQTEEQKRIAALEAERAEEKKTAKEREEEEGRQRREYQKQQQMSRFVREISPAEAPFLTTMHPAKDVPGLVNEMLSERGPDGMTLLESFRAEHDRNPSDREIRSALEHRAGERAKDLYERLKKLYEPPSQPAQAPTASESTSGPPSLSNQHAGKTISGRSDGKLSLEEKRRKNDADFKARLEAEAAAEG